MILRFFMVIGIAFVVSIGMAVEGAPYWTIFPSAFGLGLLTVIAFKDLLE